MYRTKPSACVPPDSPSPVARCPGSGRAPVRAAWAALGLLTGLAFGPPAQAVPDRPAPETPPAPAVSASAAILVDTVTGSVLWERNAYQRRPMASTTKVMTAALMIERARMTDMVPISAHATRTEYAGLHATPGELIGMQDLLYAVLLRSANDGCVAAAEYIAGSEAAFVGLMNQRARELGALDTHFVTTNGLHDPQHYTTASDLSRIARYAMRYAIFNQVVATPQYRMTSRTVNLKDTLIKNHNKLLDLYAGADGIKTGYVRQSGRCLVASATRLEGNYPWRLLAVVLNSKDTYRDSGALLDYGFRYFQPVFFARQGEQVGSLAVAGGVDSRVPLVAPADRFRPVRRGVPAATRLEVRAREARAPLRADRVAGTALCYLNGELVDRVELLPARAVGMAWTAKLSQWGGWSLLALLMMALGPRYARSVAEGARRRRSRVAPEGRNADRRWPGECGWSGRTGTWN